MNRTQVLQENMKLVVWCAKRFGPRQMSLEDRVQEAALAAWLNLAKYDPERDRALSTFLSVVMRNRLYTLCRESQREVVTVALNEGIPVMSTNDDPEAPILMFDAHREVMRAVSSIGCNRHYRDNRFQHSDVVEMLACGMTKSEISRKLGVSRERIGQIVAEVRARRSA
jgi:RNA polymerase sigma factor (sigma-70 family)